MPSGIILERFALQQNLPSPGGKDSAQAFEQGALARPIRADEAEELAGLNLQGNILQSLAFKVRVRKALDGNHQALFLFCSK
jgi:hypothetical protein